MGKRWDGRVIAGKGRTEVKDALSKTVIASLLTTGKGEAHLTHEEEK